MSANSVTQRKNRKKLRKPPTFIIIESVEETPMSKLSPFKIEKTLKSFKPKSTKKLNNGNLLIETNNEKQSKEILKIKLFDNIKVRCYPHPTLNTCKGVVKSHELSLCSLEEIETNLQEQNVTEVRRIQIKKNGETINTNTYILTFNSHTIPKEIKVGYMKINVEIYIPNPLQCFKCQKFGHHQDRCTRSPVCGRCGESGQHNDCKNDFKCANCQGNHGASARNCVIWKREKEVTKIKHTNNISYIEARKLVETRTYAETTKKSTPTNTQNNHIYETVMDKKFDVLCKLIKEMKELLEEMRKMNSATPGTNSKIIISNDTNEPKKQTKPQTISTTTEQPSNTTQTRKEQPSNTSQTRKELKIPPDKTKQKTGKERPRSTSRTRTPTENKFKALETMEVEHNSQ